MRAKDIIPASKPRNFVAKNQKTAGAGAHKDKKKAAKQGDVKHKGKEMSEGLNPNDLDGYVYDSKNRYLGQWDGQRLVIDPAVWQRWKDENGQDWASGMVGMAKDRIAAGVWKVQQEKQGVAEGPRDAYQRDYDSSVSGFGGRNRADDWDEGNTEPPNNMAVYINGKLWKVFQGNGYYADDEREMRQYYKLQDWARKKSEQTGKKWEVSRTGAPATA